MLRIAEGLEVGRIGSGLNVGRVDGTTEGSCDGATVGREDGLAVAISGDRVGNKLGTLFALRTADGLDAALLLVAGNETCPQPQTSEHLAAVEIMRLGNIIVLQNKVDLVKPDAAAAQHFALRNLCGVLNKK